MKLKIFTKKDCPNCPPAKALGEEIKKEVEVVFFSTDDADGLAEAQFYAILSTPTLILCDNDENEVFSWRGDVPSKEEVLKRLKV